MATPLGRRLTEGMFWLGAAGIVIGAPAAWIWTEWKGAGFAILWGLLLILLGRFDRVTQFSLGAAGLMVQMQQKIDEAAATLKQVQRLAASTSHALLTSLMADEFMDGITMGKKLELRDRVIAELKSLGLSESDLRQVEADWRKGAMVTYWRRIGDLVQKEMNAAKRSHDDVNSFAADYQNLLDYKSWTAPAPDQIQTFLQGRGLASTVALEWIGEYRHYVSTNEMRRPDELSPR